MAKRRWSCENCGYNEIVDAHATFVLCPECDSIRFDHGSIIEDYDNLADPNTTFEDEFGARLVVVNEIDDEGDINILPSEHNMFFSREDAIALAKHILRVCGEEI